MTNDDEPQQFSYRTSVLVGFAFLGFSIIWPIFNQLVPIFLQAGNPEFEARFLAEGRQLPAVVGFGLSPALALFIMTWDNLVNMVVQPWVGARSDRTWTRFGRRKPYIIIGAPIAAVGFVLLPFAQTAALLAGCILITTVGMALFRAPAVAWLGDLFPRADRSKASAILNMMAAAGNLLSFVGGGLLFNTVGRAAPFIAGAAVMLVSTGISVWRVREPRPRDLPPASGEAGKAPQPLRDSLHTLRTSGSRGVAVLLFGVFLWFIGFFALEAGLSSFAVFSLGIDPGRSAIYTGAASLAFILFAWPAGLLGTHFGRRPTILLGLAGLGVVLGSAYFVISGALGYVIVLFLVGLFWDMVNINSLPLVYDLGDKHRIGAFTGLFFFASQLAAVIGPILSGLLVEAQGSQYRWIFPFAAVCFSLAGLVVFRVQAVHVRRVTGSRPAH